MGKRLPKTDAGHGASGSEGLRAPTRRRPRHPPSAGPALVGAARRGRLAEVRRLLAAGAPVDSADSLGTTALHHAVQRGRAGRRIAFALLDAGAGPGRPDRSGNTPLIEAALRGDVELVRVMLAAPCRADHRNRRGETALTSAVAWRHRGVVRELLRAGVDPNIADRRGGTALMLAAMRGDMATADRLLRAGAKASLVDGAGNDAAKHAGWYGHETLARALKRHCPSAGRRGGSGRPGLGTVAHPYRSPDRE